MPSSDFSISMAVWFTVGIKLFPSIKVSKVESTGVKPEKKISLELTSVRRVLLLVESNLEIFFRVI